MSKRGLIKPPCKVEYAQPHNIPKLGNADGEFFSQNLVEKEHNRQKHSAKFPKPNKNSKSYNLGIIKGYKSGLSKKQNEAPTDAEHRGIN